MPSANLGRVKPIFKGAYAAGTTYKPLDFVTYNNSTYFCIAQTTGNLPTNATYWQPVVDGTGLLAAVASVQSAQARPLFALPGTLDVLETAGIQEVSKVTTVADVGGGLNNKYFRIYGQPLVSSLLGYTGDPVAVDVWLNVGGAGVQPASGAARWIDVAVAANAGADTIAAAIIAAVDADPAFIANGVPGQSNALHITHAVAGNTTNIADAGATGFAVETVVPGSGSLTGLTKWIGGVLAPNGCIYGIPRDAAVVLKIDPARDTVTTFGALGATAGKWAGGVLAPNGMIYGIPSGSTAVLKIDPTTDTATTFGTLAGTAKWSGGVLARNGMIYGIPSNSASVLKIDPSTDTATTFGALGATASKWSGGVLAPNGMIYGVPANGTAVLKVNPSTDSATTFGSFAGNDKWLGCALGSNGMIYGIPGSSTSILKIDPATDTATTFGALSGTLKWTGGILAPNGFIYGVPRDSGAVLKINTATDTATTIGALSGAEATKWAGAVLAPSGTIYCIPRDAIAVLKIPTGLIDCQAWMLSAYVNKY